MSEQLFDVLAVNLNAARVKWVVEGKPKDDADAIVKMAVARQGNSECFFTVEPTGKYKVGDEYLKTPSK